MRLHKLSTAMIALASFVMAPATIAAQGNSGHGHAGAPKTTATGKKSGGAAPKTSAPKTNGSKAPTTVHADAKGSSSKKTSAPQTAKSPSAAPSTTAIDFTTTPLGSKLARNDAIR